MIDWVTMICETPPELHEKVRKYLDTIPNVMRFTPCTGEIEYQKTSFHSLRSDDAAITIFVSQSRITICGSPARSMALPNNVFGSDSVFECMLAHYETAQRCLPFILPNFHMFWVTQIDKTFNYDLGSFDQVKQALNYLRHSEGGRYRIQTKAESVYWGTRKSMRSGKAYAKGPHMARQRKFGDAIISDDHLVACDRLLRLELTLGNEFWRRKRAKGLLPWDVDLDAEFDNYFGKLIGTVEVAEMNEIDLIKKYAPTDGLALAAFRTWCLFKTLGYECTKASMPKSSFYRHLKILTASGLSYADFQAGRVVEFRRRSLILDSPVTSFVDLLAA